MRYALALMLIALTANASDTIPLLDSNGKTSKIKWNIVNDTVMGGRSSSRWSDKSSTLSFEGFLSLENNGGFASVRHDLNNINLSGTEGIFIKVKGDGRKYQFRIRSQASRWANYSQEFKTKKNTVQTFYLPYKDFKPSWRGRSVRNVPTLTGKDVRELKKKYPGIPVVSYVNTSADVKSETDVCCTSANAVKIVNSLGVRKVIFLPDDYLAKYVASQTEVEIISWKGTCEVHEQFNDEEINQIRKENPGIKVIAHPECPPDVIKASDFTGSTSGMIKYVKDNQPEKVMMVTECSMSDNVQVDNPNVEFIRPCNLCPHMKRITLPKILDCLKNETNEILLDDKTINAARKSVIRMTEIGR